MLKNVIDTGSIYGFASVQANNAPPEESIFVLTANQLQDLYKKAVLEALGGQEVVQDTLRHLEEANRALNAKLEAFQRDLDVQAENQLIQLKLIADLRKDREPEPTKKTTTHLDELYRLMREENSAQISISKAARFLGISKERMRQLKPLILKDDRFDLIWSNIRGQKGTVIRIHHFLK